MAAKNAHITDEVISKVLEYQAGLIKKKDVSCHTIDKALNLTRPKVYN
jgi:hypothetical protein